MQVRALWRYPVKSMQGEQLDQADVDARGLAGDRAHALFDVATGVGLTARRVHELLMASARLRDDGPPEITLPDGSVAEDDAALSAWLGREVTLRSADSREARRYENPADFEDETGEWDVWDGSTGAFHDSGRTHVSLLSTDTYGAWEPRRFRANVLLDGSGEDELVGSTISLGDAELDVRKPVDRCVMVTRPQPGGIERDLDVLRTIHRQRGGCLAVGAVVTQGGAVRTGDVLHTM